MDWTSGSPDIRASWTLDETVAYLNHGSFGATPRPVLDEQARLRAEMEREPVHFLARTFDARIAVVRQRLATFLGADARGLVAVPNATTGVATVLRSLPWREGDEIVLADHAYNAVKQAVRFLGEHFGVKMVEARVPFPLASAEQVVEAFDEAIGPRTKLVIVDHVTSATALVFPVAEIVACARAHAVPVLVDGAHAPALLPLALDALAADFYVGNLHKWLCAPKGAAFLHVAPAWRDRVRPLVPSHGYGGGFFAEFDWTGTDDPTAWLSVPAAIDFFEALGPERVRASNHALVREGRVAIARALGVDLPHPDDPALYGPMAAIPFPRGGVPAELNRVMFERHRIEVPFTTYDGRVWVRISGQVYNRPEEYARLADVLRAF
ncbi:MAG: aminotransferase class V-fold PLP-dependent enzyme [Myxococcota bacterium]